MLFVDSFPGYVCGFTSKKVDGVTLQSSSSSSYATHSCVIRFIPDTNTLTPNRLMLKFVRFSITDRSVELKIRGASGGDVR